MISLSDDDFALMGLPRRFGLDPKALDARWKDLQRQTHPDRFAAQGTAAQRVAMQWSVRVNEAYQRLRDPVKRAAYLCELAGASIDAERNTAMPAEFLVQQMEWRESMEDSVVARDIQGLSQLMQEVQASLAESELLVEHLLDSVQPNYEKAAQEVRRMMFLVKFKSQLVEEQKRVSHGAAANR